MPGIQPIFDMGNSDTAVSCTVQPSLRSLSQYIACIRIQPLGPNQTQQNK